MKLIIVGHEMTGRFRALLTHSLTHSYTHPLTHTHIHLFSVMYVVKIVVGVSVVGSLSVSPSVSVFVKCVCVSVLVKCIPDLVFLVLVVLGKVYSVGVRVHVVFMLTVDDDTH